MSEINPLLREEPMHDDTDRALRPKSLREFIGQSEARSNLSVFIESARQRNDAMDHTLFFGSIAITARTDKQSVEPDFGLKTTGWNKLYEALFGGFDDVDQDDDENEIDELEAIPDSMKTQDGYLKDGFVVGSDADSEEDEDASEPGEDDTSDEEDENTDGSDADDGEELDAKLDGLSECSEEEYVYSDED